MSNAVVLYDINHIIIDNLQFMIGSQFPNAFDKYKIAKITMKLNISKF